MASKTVQQKLRLPTLRKPTALPEGARRYRPLPMEEWPVKPGPGDPPPGFVTATTSATEWMVYWALSKIFNNPLDPRQPPYEGGWPDWTFQDPYNGGRREPGGSVIDFIVYNPGRGRNQLALRIVTEYWHLYTSGRKQATDQMQKETLSAGMDVVDLYDFDFVNDPTGQAVIIATKNALGMIERPNPILLGTALRGSRMDKIG